MKRNNIIIIGCLGLNAGTLAKTTIKDAILVLADNIEAKNVINPALQNEPIQLINTYKDNFDYTENDIPRNKYLDKPRHNYKRR